MRIGTLGMCLVALGLASVQSGFAAAKSGYRDFLPTTTQKEALASRRFILCINNANAMIALINDCNDSEYKRLDRRLNASYRTTLRRLSRTKSMALRSDERAWVATRDEACLADLTPVREGGGVIYSNLMGDCRIEELTRRIIWIETRR